MLSFTVLNESKNGGRCGIIKTHHGDIMTPAFIFCGTKAAIKACTIEDMIKEKTQIILSNTYHLMISPGENLIKKFGGLHKFFGWEGPMFTDSGGYQIFSMGHGSVSEEIKGSRNFKTKNSSVKIFEDGAEFKSHKSGEKFFLTPERSIEIQNKLGADIIVAFDECTPFNVDKKYTEKSMRRSHIWELRSLEKYNQIFKNKNEEEISQGLYGIVQGGVYDDLREESAEFLNSNDFFGHAIGGSLGNTKEEMYRVVNFVMRKLKKDRPIHLLGIGKISDIFYGVKLGIDTFDCVHPTRLSRHGGALIKKGTKIELENFSKINSFVSKNIDNRLLNEPDFLTNVFNEKNSSLKNEKNFYGKEHINLRNSIFKEDTSPIEKDCECQTCQKYSRGYIHHLLKNDEIISHNLLTRHNVHFMNKLMEEIREGIKKENLAEVEKRWI